MLLSVGRQTGSRSDAYKTYSRCSSENEHAVAGLEHERHGQADEADELVARPLQRRLARGVVRGPPHDEDRDVHRAVLRGFDDVAAQFPHPPPAREDDGVEKAEDEREEAREVREDLLRVAEEVEREPLARRQRRGRVPLAVVQLVVDLQRRWKSRLRRRTPGRAKHSASVSSATRTAVFQTLGMIVPSTRKSVRSPGT